MDKQHRESPEKQRIDQEFEAWKQQYSPSGNYDAATMMRYNADQMKLAQQKQHEEWKRQMEMAGIATGSGQATQAARGRVGEIMWNPGGILGADACAQEAQPEREVAQATRQLDHALQRLATVVDELHIRTSDVQRQDAPMPATESAVQRELPSAALASVIAQAAIMVLDQVEKLEGMERRIQL